MALEEYAYILDYLPQGRSKDKSYHKTPLALAVGETELKLLELIPKPNALIAVGEKVYIGKDPEKREKILSVRRRISYSDLTSAGINELPYTLELIINQKEQFFLKFFNESQPINTRKHTLELLPGFRSMSFTTTFSGRSTSFFISLTAFLATFLSIFENPSTY